MRVDKYSLGTKMYASSGAMMALLFVLGVYAVIALTSLQGKIANATSREAKKIELAGAITAASHQAQSAQRGILLGALTSDAKGMESSDSSLRSAKEQLERSLKEMDGLIITAEGRQSFAGLKSVTEEWLRQAPQYQAHIQGQRFDEATKMQAETLRPLSEKMVKESEVLAGVCNRLMTATADEANTQVSFARIFAALLVLISIGVSAVAFWVIRTSNVELRRIATEIGEGSNQVASASQQVASSSQAVAQGSSEQAASLEETSASTEEINSMTQKNAENARNAATETEKADQLLKETDQKLTQMIGSMKEINTSSEKIGKIIRVIDEIAFQTNILALNAAVEAARAGEAGMGFAVVADEVRNLAQRCAQAAKDTSELIEESIVRSNEGKVRLDEVAGCVSRVFENASRIRLLSNEVHVGSQEQARGIEQISRSVAQMQSVTQAAAASAEEGASAGEEMSAQSLSLQDAVTRLKDLVGGDAHVVTASPRRVPSGPRSMARQLAPLAKAVGKPVAPAKSAPVLTASRPAHADFPMDDDFKDF